VNYEALEIVGVFIKFQNVKPPIENGNGSGSSLKTTVLKVLHKKYT